MAVPPITVGELTNVPTIGSDVASGWAQSASNRVVHRFAVLADATASNLVDGSVAMIGGFLHVRRAGVWVEMVTGTNGRIEYTPALAQGVNLANVKAYADYTLQGKQVAGRFNVSYDILVPPTADQPIIISVPLPMYGPAPLTTNSAPVGIGTIIDLSTGLRHKGWLVPWDSTRVAFMTLESAYGLLGQVGMGLLGNGDAVMGTFAYPIA